MHNLPVCTKLFASVMYTTIDSEMARDSVDTLL